MNAIEWHPALVYNPKSRGVYPMSPTKDTEILTARVKKPLVEILNQRAKRRGITINGWLNWAIRQGIRSHKRKL